MKCSGERSQALRMVTAPAGSSRRDFPVGPLPPPEGLSSSEAEWSSWWSGDSSRGGADVVAAAAVFIVSMVVWGGRYLIMEFAE